MSEQRKKSPESGGAGESVTPLIGHSGCEIVLLQGADGARVRKTSKSKDYNPRLKLQCQKQKDFSVRDGVKVPKILSQGSNDSGLFFFEMEYISGQSFASYIENESSLNARWVAEKLYALLDANHSVVDSEFSKKFVEKTLSLESQLPSSPLIQQSLDTLKAHIWKPELLSACHGDLTFENMIYARNGDVYLIDFLDSFCESWIVDLSKLLQDIELQWSFRNRPGSPFINIRLNAILKELFSIISRRPDGNEIINTAYHALLLNVLRIIPYSADNTKPYLDQLLKKSLHKIQALDTKLKGTG